MTAMRGWRPRTPLVPNLPLPSLRTAQAVTPINPSTIRKAKKKRTASGISAPNKSNIQPTPPVVATARLVWTLRRTLAAENLANTNKELKPMGDVEYDLRKASISMVNGTLMAKCGPDQVNESQVLRHLISTNAPGRRSASPGLCIPILTSLAPNAGRSSLRTCLARHQSESNMSGVPQRRLFALGAAAGTGVVAAEHD